MLLPVVVGALLLPAAAASAATPEPVVLTAPAAQRFLDEALPRLVEQYDVPGATAAVVVPGGEVVTAAAGTADVATGRPLTPDTPVRVASISKSFTAVAVLQLVDQGRLGLDTPVEDVLPPDVPVAGHAGWRSVTVRDLLTHTAGFEERLVGTTSPPGEAAPDLHAYLRDARVGRLHAPGTVVAYSNYGFALLGLVVQTVTGTPFAAQVDATVLGALGMTRSGFAEPGDDVAVSHLRDGDGWAAAPATGMAEAPAGAATSTATDMGRYLRWLLADDHAPVLDEASAAGMLARQHGIHPALPGGGWGTWERLVPGVADRLVGHEGDLAGAHSAYVVDRDRGAGLFVAVDGDPADVLHDLRRALVEEFAVLVAGGAGGADGSDGPGAPAATGAGDGGAGAVEGTYVTSRRSDSDASALKVALDNMAVSALPGGGLRTVNPALGTTTWAPVGPDTYRAPDGELLALVRDDDGQVRALGTSVQPSQEYLRVDALHDPGHHLVAGGAGLLVALVAAAGAASGLVRARRRGPGARAGGAVAADALVLGSGLALVVGLGLIGAATAAPAGIEAVITRGSATLVVPFTVATVLAAATAVAAAALLVRRVGSRWARARTVAAAVGAGVVCAVAVAYHLTLLG